MQKLNYDLEMQEILAIKKSSVLLHACCAPCSSAVLERISSQADLTIYFYNPNIIPETEYNYRLQELKRLVREMPSAQGIEILEGNYEPEKFLAFAEALANEPERGKRCQKCIALRLEETAKLADNLGADYFATTLTLSPHKDAFFINTAGFAIAENFHVNWLPSDFKKKEGYKRSILLSHEYCLYRQDFCGCPFSKKLKHPES
ncbi:MAG: epoxyqueuosine reductase QueH [Oscillospiraceae bacterium]|nr:epoxyqueuosine reductase QueH [Oscillospiraceae bacterium]